MRRRTLLRLGGATMTGALAGCPGLSSGRPVTDPNTGLDGNPSASLDGTPVSLAGDAAGLPVPPTVVDSLADAEVVLATPDTETGPLADAFRGGATVAFAGRNAPAALVGLLDAVGDSYRWGTETANGQPVRVTVAVPRGELADTFQFVREGGWDEPVLDPVGWALDGRVPNCRTFVPEGSNDDDFSRLGSAWIAGRLDSGETYAVRTTASRDADTGTPDLERFRFRSAVHAAANDGYDVATARRVVDFPNDRRIDWFPNPHERNGVDVSNHSSPIAERLDVSFSPANARGRAAITGCCGVTVNDALAYDHRTRWTWTDDGLLGSDNRYGGGIGRGEWNVPG